MNAQNCSSHASPDAGIIRLVLDASPETFEKPVPPVPIPHRQRSSYLLELERAREKIGEVPRETFPELMNTLPTPLHVGDAIDPEWLAWRDAILERALALGYIVGQVGERVYANRRDYWSMQVVGQVGARTIRYPIGGWTAEVGKIPPFNQAVLMTRGEHVVDREDHENRPYIPVGKWFLHDPVSST